MGRNRRGRGKQGTTSSGRSTPATLSSDNNNSNNNNNDTDDNNDDTKIGEEGENDNKNDENMDVEDSKDKSNKTDDDDDNEDEIPLVLTSEKKQNAYECDYCHQDISQQPRIRCATCVDFDLCLDCFATTDHSAMVARIKATAHTQSELSKDGVDSTNIVGVAISSAALNHDDTHGYRVCDNTRYPIFSSGRVAPTPLTSTLSATGGPEASTATSVVSSTNGNNDENSDDDDDDGGDDNNKMDIDDDKVSATTSAESAPATAAGAGGGATSTTAAGADDAKSTTSSAYYAPSNFDAVSVVSEVPVSEDPKYVWTAEEDLRLIDAIKTHGLGNWIDISEAISGNGSVGKTPKRCMERYFDDFLGRYGQILPPWTVVDDDLDAVGNIAGQEEPSDAKDGAEADEQGPAPATPAKSTTTGAEEEAVRSSKRQRNSLSARMPASLLAAVAGTRSKKKLKVVPTESLPNYDQVWPKPYLPSTGVTIGQEVARDLAYKAELTFVKATMAASTKEEADKIRQEWLDTKMGQIGSPTVLPPRPDDAVHLPGSELAGFMPRRGDFDVEWENDAEAALADMEFTSSDTPQEKQLKLQVLDIYCQKLDEREKRKDFILSRHLYDYRKYVQDEQSLPADERDLVHRMRLFERFHTLEEHKQFISDILKAKRLRKEIAKLQMYRRIGIRSLAEAEKYELDKNRRQFHKIAQMQRQAEAKAKAAGGANATTTGTANKGDGPEAGGAGSSALYNQDNLKESLWKQYRTTTDRKARRSSSRSATKTDDGAESAKEGEDKETGDPFKTAGTEEKDDNKDEGEATKSDEIVSDPTAEEGEGASPEEVEKDKTKSDVPMAMEIDEEKSKDEKIEDNEFDITSSRGYSLLSRKEHKLCERLKIYPIQYLEIKKVLIHEALTNGLLDKDSSSAGRRTIVKIDVTRRGNIVDFLVRAGWISRNLADASLRIVSPCPPPPLLAAEETSGPEEPQEDVETVTT